MEVESTASDPEALKSGGAASRSMGCPHNDVRRRSTTVARPRRTDLQEPAMSKQRPDVNEIRRRFVRGLLLELSPNLLREFVTGVPEDEDDGAAFKDAA